MFSGLWVFSVHDDFSGTRFVGITGLGGTSASP